MAIDETYQRALASPQPSEELWHQVRLSIESGYPRADLATELEQLYTRLLAEGSEPEQEAVASVLDALTGWSSPAARI